ncbi:MAG TPA: hypothetical protein VK982_00960 [Bacteroidales bacterium]|nr:hypothetical protein [Bacteroidales bacterium]
MDKIKLLAIVLLFLLACGSTCDQKHPPISKPEPTTTVDPKPQPTIDWLVLTEEMKQFVLDKNQCVLLYFGHCGTECQQFETTVLTNPNVVSLVNEAYVPFRSDRNLSAQEMQALQIAALPAIMLMYSEQDSDVKILDTPAELNNIFSHLQDRYQECSDAKKVY